MERNVPVLLQLLVPGKSRHRSTPITACLTQRRSAPSLLGATLVATVNKLTILAPPLHSWWRAILRPPYSITRTHTLCNTFTYTAWSINGLFLCCCFFLNRVHFSLFLNFLFHDLKSDLLLKCSQWASSVPQSMGQ